MNGEVLSSLPPTPQPDCGRPFPTRANPNGEAQPVHLLDELFELRVHVGDGLNDAEFTELMLRRYSEARDGFQLLCFSDGCVTLSVPPQPLDRWYPKDRWIAPDMEELARSIAEKYDLSLCEPPDRLSYIVLPARAHHHIELITRWDTVAVAHPLYLKLRLFGSRSSNRVMWTPKIPLPPAGALMTDLVNLYYV